MFHTLINMIQSPHSGQLVVRLWTVGVGVCTSVVTMTSSSWSSWLVSFGRVEGKFIWCGMLEFQHILIGTLSSFFRTTKHYITWTSRAGMKICELFYGLMSYRPASLKSVSNPNLLLFPVWYYEIPIFFSFQCGT